MEDNRKITKRANIYLSLLETEGTKSNKVYKELLAMLEKGHSEDGVTLADLLLVVFQELGYIVKPKGKELNKKGNDLDKNGQPIVHGDKYNKYAAFFDEKENSTFYKGSKQNEHWCAIFVHWVLFKALGEKQARKATYIEQGKKHGAGVEYGYEYYPDFLHLYLDHHLVRSGDQAFFYTKDGLSHTGLVVANDGEYVYIIEGNTNPQVGTDNRVIPIGKGVYLKRYPISRLDIEYCHPRYEFVRSPKGFDLSAVIVKIVELYETLKEEMEQRLTPEELVNSSKNSEEISDQVKLQILKNKIKKLISASKTAGKVMTVDYLETLSAMVYQLKGVTDNVSEIVGAPKK